MLTRYPHGLRDAQSLGDVAKQGVGIVRRSRSAASSGSRE